jgi:hypothetical protein
LVGGKNLLDLACISLGVLVLNVLYGRKIFYSLFVRASFLVFGTCPLRQLGENPYIDQEHDGRQDDEVPQNFFPKQEWVRPVWGVGNAQVVAYIEKQHVDCIE